MIKLWYSSLGLVGLLLMGISCAGETTTNNTVVTSPTEIVIATLIAPTTGASQSQLSYQAAAKLAADDANQALKDAGSKYTVKLVNGDLGADPVVALASLKTLYTQGVRLVVGPAESANLFALKEFADTNGMIIISNASTAPTLSYANDSIYRLVPSDVLQTKALAKKISDDGFKNLIIVYRHELYGDDFRRGLEEAFTAVSGTVVAELQYEPDTAQLTTDRPFKQYVQALRDSINTADPAIDPTKTAIVMVSFEEIVPIVKEMITTDETLFKKLRFYGGDGTAQITDITADSQVAAFLLGTQFLATTPAASDPTAFNAFVTRLNATFTGSVSFYAAIAYDAVALLTKTGADLKAKGKYDSISDWRTDLREIAAATMGITGNLAFNDAGDRANLPYGLWGLELTGTTYSWKFNGLLAL